MQTGISIYMGLDNTLEENLALIEAAAKCGCTKIFTSLHIPEADYAKLKSEFNFISRAAKENNMAIISDVSPQTLEFLGINQLDKNALIALGITILRMDYGVTPQEIAALSRCGDIKVQINASTATREFLTTLEKHHADFSRIDALHNFYPREGTGLSEKFFAAKNALLKEFSLKTGAFIASGNRPRAPLFMGLPTLEAHRQMSVSLAARHLAALGCDNIFIGDSLPSLDELGALSVVEDDAVILRFEKIADAPFIRRLLAHKFTTRADEARDAFRAAESRALCKNIVIKKENAIAIERGSVTLDNEGYGRYQGELQISKIEKKADSRVNVIGKVKADEIFLLDYLYPARSFRFIY
jgi:hypothetical protein